MIGVPIEPLTRIVANTEQEVMYCAVRAGLNENFTGRLVSPIAPVYIRFLHFQSDNELNALRND